MPDTNLRRLGRSELSVHPLCLGGNTFGWTNDRAQSFAVLDAYVEAGGNFIDTADTYSGWVPGNRGGESETIIGAWLAQRSSSDDVIVATKVGSGAEEVPKGLARAQVIAGCDASLRRLGVERIDLYFAHRDDPATPLEETLGAFDELVRAGKVAHIAASNFSPERLRESLAVSEAHGFASYSVLQPQFNLIDREGDAAFNDARRAIAEEHDLGVAVYSALASGFLTGKYREGAPDPSSPRAGGVRSTYLSDPRARRAARGCGRDRRPLGRDSRAGGPGLGHRRTGRDVRDRERDEPRAAVRAARGCRSRARREGSRRARPCLSRVSASR